MQDQDLYNRISRDGLIATDAVRVQMTIFNEARDRVHIAAWADEERSKFGAALRQIQRIIPGFDPNAVTLPPDVNTHNYHVYIEGQPILAPLHELAEGIVDRRVARLAEVVAHMRFGYVCPLHVDGVVVGALTFLFDQRPDPAKQRTCEAFARQAALSMENAGLRTHVEQERAILHQTLSSLSDGVIAVDEESGVVAWNAKANAYIGPTEAEMLGKGPQDVIHTIQERIGDPKIDEFLTAAFQGQLDSADSMEIVVQGGSPSTLLLTVFPISKAVRQVIGILIHDVTDEREFERRRSQFFSIATHELRAPMTVLLGYSELLVSRDVEKDAHDRWLSLIHQESKRLSAFIDDFLSVSRLERGVMTFHPEPSDIVDIIEPIIEGYRATVPSHLFVIEAEPSLPLVFADRNRLNQVLANLIDNAVKYSPSGGTVTVTAAQAMGTAGLAVSVTDEGIGIASEHQERLFETFQRLETPETRNIKGTGLGLYIVKSLVELMGGTISVSSQPGVGSRFSFILPIASASDQNG